MECQGCKKQMDKGFYSGGFWARGDKPFGAGLAKFWGRETIYVIAWKCPSCKTIELKAEK